MKISEDIFDTAESLISGTQNDLFKEISVLHNRVDIVKWANTTSVDQMEQLVSAGEISTDLANRLFEMLIRSKLIGFWVRDAHQKRLWNDTTSITDAGILDIEGLYEQWKEGTMPSRFYPKDQDGIFKEAREKHLKLIESEMAEIAQNGDIITKAKVLMQAAKQPTDLFFSIDSNPISHPMVVSISVVEKREEVNEEDTVRRQQHDSGDQSEDIRLGDGNTPNTS
jgi:hypothetical protein